MAANYAVVFFAWGDFFVHEVEQCIKKSRSIHQYDLFLLTDNETNVKGKEHYFKEVIRVDFQSTGLIRKAELIHHVPESYDACLLLDTDTIVLDDISLGFEKAEQYGIAVAPAHHYGLDSFWNFREVMAKENHPQKGQLQYNTGVIFFNNSPEVFRVMELWRELSLTYQHILRNDQPFFTLALEKLGFNPYTLPITYNYRGSGDVICGKVRIWHSHLNMPPGINKSPEKWPPRRAYPAKMVYRDLNRFAYRPRRLFDKIKERLDM